MAGVTGAAGPVRSGAERVSIELDLALDVAGDPRIRRLHARTQQAATSRRRLPTRSEKVGRRGSGAEQRRELERRGRRSMARV